jgi:hypothetical protein
MTTTIKLKNGTGVPTAGALVQGEPAFDLTNKRLYTENAGGTVIEVGTNPSTLSVTGSATVGSTLGVTGAAIFSSTVAGAFNGTLGATTPASVAATTLSTTGAVTFGGALDVTGTVTADGLTVQTTNGLSAVLESANSYQHLQFKNSGYIENYIDFTNRDFNITCDNVNRFTINGTNGNVGIGTNSPSSYDFNDPAKLVVANTSGNSTLTIASGASNIGYLAFADGTTGTSRYSGSVQYNHSTNALSMHTTDGTARLTISSTGAATFSGAATFGGDVIVSGANPANSLLAQLSVKSTAALANGNASGISFWAQTSSGLGAYGSIQAVTTGDYAGKLVFTTRNGAGAFDPRMTLDASGNLLVGTTSAFGTTGTTINPAGLIYSSADGDRSGQFDRTTNDGEIVRFSKAGTTVGSIGTGFGLLTIGTGTGNLLFENALVAPCSDSSLGASNGVVDLGASTRRFKDLYLSGGVYLGGTGAANLLNDYETGVFTPTLSFGGASVGITYSNQYGRYTKVGRQVTVQVGMYLTSKGTSTGGALVSGLPFNVTTQAGGFGSYAGTFKGAGMASLSNATNVIADENTTTLLLEENNASGASALTNANFTDATYFMATITYFN